MFVNIPIFNDQILFCEYEGIQHYVILYRNICHITTLLRIFARYNIELIPCAFHIIGLKTI